MHPPSYVECKFLSVLELEDDEHCIAKYEAENTHDDSDFHHILLLDESCRVCNCIWRCADRQNH